MTISYWKTANQNSEPSITHLVCEPTVSLLSNYKGCNAMKEKVCVRANSVLLYPVQILSVV